MANEMKTKEYTWEDLESAVGQDFSSGAERAGVDPIERSQIRRYMEPFEMDCPLYWDDEVARQHGYKGIVAPVSSLTAPFSRGAIWQPGDPTRFPNTDPDDMSRHREHKEPGPQPLPLPMPPTTSFFATDVEHEYFEPAYVGDRLTTRGHKLLSVAVKRTSVGFGAFIVWESELVNQDGKLIAKLRLGGYHYNPHPQGDASQ